MMLTPEQLAELREYVGNGSGFSGASGLLALLEHIDAKQARIAELEQDAARYRWLREQASIVHATEGNIKWEWESGEYGEPDHSLDRFIDAAMQK